MNHAIILSAGESIRTKDPKEKLLIEVGGKPIIYYSIMSLNDHPEIDSITMVVSKNNEEAIKKIVKKYRFFKVKNFVLGGKTRQESLQKGVNIVQKKLKNNDIVLVHNGANPLPSQKEISEVIKKTEKQGACITGRYICSTIKEINKKHITKTHNREKLFEAQTPQAAKFELIEKALRNAKKKGINATDEAVLLEAIGHKVAYTEADENNFKITTSADIERLRHILGETPKGFQVGIGQDSHLFEEKKKGLVLGGFLMKDELKLEANSDGDVILHAIFNAISQGLGGKSIGFYADEMCENGVKNSKKYIEKILCKMRKKSFSINSLGIMLECKTPKIDPVIPGIKKSLEKIFGLKKEKIGITATSGENATIFGKGLGIQCFAIVSLIKDKH